MGNSKGSTIGARVLHEKEIEQSLPTYGKLTDQIEAVRPIAREYRKNQQNTIHMQSDFVLPQVINNFSILGSRGTGKSSILKTLYQHLQSENTDTKDHKKQKNILLPTIVPENLVENVSLMGCVLGLLKENVDQICKSKESNRSICPAAPHPLKKTYTDLMHEFVQLQQPYEQVSVQQFSTNSEYTRTIISMLEAGNQFALKFRQFIEQLLNEYADDALLFIFIDDIDLSTNRCGDLVKTLLSYLSHPAIVTILAGDISIFGESLTLDFLRHEQIPDTEFVTKSYLVEKSQYGQYGDEMAEENMIGRKKQLAYEYLKKVMPPNNRHFIVNWSLAFKRNFCIMQKDEGHGQDETKTDTLASLLRRLNRHIPMLHGYLVDWEWSKQSELSNLSEPSYQNEDGRQDSLLYYPFDTTARGLVSSYRAIQMLVEKLDSHHKENEEINLEAFYADIKFLVESVVAANYELSAAQHLIFHQFLSLGNTLENSDVRFDNFYIWLIQTLPNMEFLETEKRTKTQTVTNNANKAAGNQGTSLNIKSEILAFQIFVFLDWTSRLLGKNDVISGKEYEKTKKAMLFLLCVNGYINEGNLNLSKAEQDQFRSISQSKDYPLFNILDGYYDLPFPAAVRYFQSFNIPWFLSAHREKQKGIYYEKYLDYTVRYIDALDTHFGKESSELGLFMKQHPDMLTYVESFLNHKHKNLLLSTLCKEYFYKHSTFYKLYITSGCFRDQFDGRIKFDLNPIEENYLSAQTEPLFSDDVEKYISNLPIKSGLNRSNNYWAAYIKKEWLNFVIPSANSDKLTPFYNSYLTYANRFFDGNGKLVKLSYYTKDDLQGIGFTDQKQIDIICNIDEQNLWDIDKQFLGEENFISIISQYIIKKLQSLEEELNVSSRPLKVQISQVKENEYKDFCKCYAGVSDTIAHRCKRNLSKILDEKSFVEGITTSQYIACIMILNQLIYSYAWYGKSEARALKAKLENCKCNIFDDMDDDKAYMEQFIKPYFFWLHCYCRYQEAHLSDSMHGVLERAADAMQSVRQGIVASDQLSRNKYIDMFAKKLDMSSEEIESIPMLFEQSKKKEPK